MQPIGGQAWASSMVHLSLHPTYSIVILFELTTYSYRLYTEIRPLVCLLEVYHTFKACMYLN